MDVDAEIEAYIAAQPEAKRSDLRALRGMILGVMPGCRLWFLDGKNDEGDRVNALLADTNGAAAVQGIDRMKAPPEKPLGLDMPFDAALARFIGTAPSELADDARIKKGGDRSRLARLLMRRSRKT